MGTPKNEANLFGDPNFPAAQKEFHTVAKTSHEDPLRPTLLPGWYGTGRKRAEGVIYRGSGLGFLSLAHLAYHPPPHRPPPYPGGRPPVEQTRGLTVGGWHTLISSPCTLAPSRAGPTSTAQYCHGAVWRARLRFRARRFLTVCTHAHAGRLRSTPISVSTTHSA